ncbi:hypothetical protein [Paraburkholderia sediminicola]|uniref:hypothetical protein n=1 Tax=Paraburkholderia sediminicola TaxID=458836 RepID=UPI0038BCDA80
MNTNSITRRRWFFAPSMNSPRALARACWIVPLMYGVYSLAQGADSNWDIRNYHLYNAFALLHGKMAIDLAPAGMQSYFNPLLDVPYYLMAMHLPAMLVGFMNGVLHGLNFVLLLCVCRRVLADLPEQERYRTPFWLALAGCFTANFMSGIGNSMGDNTTSLFCLGALLIVMTVWSRLSEVSGRVLLTIAIGGVVSGLGAGLKLTTIVYSVALCGGLLFAPISAIARLRVAFVFGVGVLLGLAATGGYWFLELWRLYGNPVYPQYSTIFPSALTSSVGAVDTKWFPTSVWEALVFPFVFAINPHRVGQVELHQAIWAAAYVVFWWWVIAAFVSRRKGVPAPSLQSTARYVVAYVVIGYVVWMKAFSIQRYLVAIELCVPLFIYLLLMQVLAYRAARKVAGVLLVLSSIGVLVGGAHSWGHDPWAKRMFAADVPQLPTPQKTTVLLTAGDPPLGWLVPMFPDTVAFATIRSAFPEARPAYDNKIHDIVRTRGGPVYALIPGYWTDGRRDAAKDAAELADSGQALTDYGFLLDAGSCRILHAHIGRGVYPYQWCRVTSSR